MPVAVSSLVTLGVPIRVVVDFDVLQDEQSLRAIVEALCGTWKAIERDWQATRRVVENRTPPLTSSQVRNEITKILDATAQNNLAVSDTDRIRRTLRATSTWDIEKQSGVDVVPSGHFRERLNSLLASLRSIGFFIVECGELERFAPSIGGHGPRWTAAAFKRDLSRESEFGTARPFVAELFAGHMKRLLSDDATVVTGSLNHEDAALPKGKRPRNNTMFHVNQILYHLGCLLRLRR